MYLIVSIGYFSNWSEINFVKNKKFLGHSSIWSKGWKDMFFFCNLNKWPGERFGHREVSRELHHLIGVEQRVTSGYHRSFLPIRISNIWYFLQKFRLWTLFWPPSCHWREGTKTLQFFTVGFYRKVALR